MRYSRRTTSGYRGMTPYMVGKVDRAGRLLTDEQKYMTNPNADWWTYQTNLVDHQIEKILGTETFDDWVYTLDFDNIPNYMEEYFISKRKLQELRANVHDTNISEKDPEIQ